MTSEAATPRPPSPSGPSTSALPEPPIKNLILDAAPLLTLTPLRGLASKYLIAPQVLAEIRDKRAREHFDRLSLMEGVEVEVRDVDAISLAKVTAFAKQTGDYAVLSHTDLCVLALTYAVEVEENGHWRVRDELGKPPAGRPPTQPAPSSTDAQADAAASSTGGAATAPSDESAAEQPVAEPSTSPKTAPPALPLHSTWGKKAPIQAATASAAAPTPVEPVTESSEVAEVSEEPEPAAASTETDPPKVDLPIYEDQPIAICVQQSASSDPFPPRSSSPPPSLLSFPDAEPSTSSLPPSTAVDDEEHDSDSDGEWITPSNVAEHKAVDLGLALPTTGGGKKKNKGKKKSKPRAILKSACMTSDFAVQNVLLQMGLNLVGGEGRRIRSVKSWVLRCHACFKLCKDPSKKFCPSCGGPTLLRTSITTVSAATPSSSSSTATTTNTPAVQTIVHLKPNFQYRLRGTQYSIPAPKPGSSKGHTSGGSGLVLREDDKEFQTGLRMEEGRRIKAERRLARGLVEGGDGGGGVFGAGGTWKDKDWMPEMYTVGGSGKGRRGEHDGFLPQIGHGRRNVNAVGRKKK